MYDLEDKRNFGYFIGIILFYMLLNIGINIFIESSVKGITSNNLLVIKPAKSVGVVWLSALSSMIILVVSLIVPKANIFEVYSRIEKDIYRYICVLIGFLFITFEIYNTVSPFLESYQLTTSGYHDMQNFISSNFQN